MQDELNESSEQTAAATENAPRESAEVSELQRRVRKTRPDFFGMGLSTPKQERFMAQYMSILPEVKIFIGVGAAFDLLTGRIRQAAGCRAPAWDGCFD